MTQKRGRPPHGEIERLRIQSWFWDIAGKLELKTGCEVEKFYKTEVNRRTKKYKFVCSNQFNHYKDGINAPDAVVNWFEKRCDSKGAKISYEHPFWELLKNPSMSLEKLHILLRSLPHDIYSHLLFDHYEHNKRPYLPKATTRKAGYSSAIKYFDQLSTLDALTACLILVCEAKYFSSDKYIYQYAESACISTRIFLRLATEPRFISIAHILYPILVKDFFINPHSEELPSFSTEINVNTHIVFNLSVLTLINHLKILKHFKKPPPACLYLTEKHLTEETIEIIHKNRHLDKLSMIRKLPVIKNITRSLRRWEKKQLHKKKYGQTLAYFNDYWQT